MRRIFLEKGVEDNFNGSVLYFELIFPISNTCLRDCFILLLLSVAHDHVCVWCAIDGMTIYDYPVHLLVKAWEARVSMTSHTARIRSASTCVHLDYIQRDTNLASIVKDSSAESAWLNAVYAAVRSHNQ